MDNIDASLSSRIPEIGADGRSLAGGPAYKIEMFNGGTPGSTSHSINPDQSLLQVSLPLEAPNS
jgi:hypothetical protein